MFLTKSLRGWRDFFMTQKRAIIFANGEIKNLGTLQGEIKGGDLLIAADGGLKYYKQLDILPHFLVGDLDSVTENEVQDCQSKGVKIEKHPAEKDETDLQLALDLAVRENAGIILVLAALGGRLDHTLGNLCLLLREDLAEREVWLDDGIEQVILIRKELVIEGHIGDRISLIPVDERTDGVSTSGLRYPLHQETLFRNQTRGISNEMISDEAVISIRSGPLLCVHTRRGI